MTQNNETDTDDTKCGKTFEELRDEAEQSREKMADSVVDAEHLWNVVIHFILERGKLRRRRRDEIPERKVYEGCADVLSSIINETARTMPDQRKPLTSKSPEPRVCAECLNGFLSIREPTYCPFCGEADTIPNTSD